MELDNIVFLDVETTGTDPCADRIIELGMVLLLDGKRLRWQRRFNPGVPIPAAATAIHGITDAEVADAKPFAWYAQHIHRALTGKHIGGYNIRRFDLIMLDQELRRNSLKLDLAGTLIFDCAGIFFQREPRALEDAVRRYCGREHGGKHQAIADAEAALDVFIGQMDTYPDLAAQPTEEIAAYSRLSDKKEADLGGKLQYDAEGRLCYAFGKHRGKPVLSEPDYAAWMMRANFPGSTCEMLQAELAKLLEV